MSSYSNTPPFSIAIFGEVLADIFPNATVLGGAPYNVARHLRAFQQHPLLISRVGNDALKEALFSELTKRDINPSGIQLDPVYPTGQVTVHMESGAHHFEIKPDQAYDHIHPHTLVTQPDIAYFCTLAQRSKESSLALDVFLNDAKCPRFLDVNLRSPSASTSSNCPEYIAHHNRAKMAKTKTTERGTSKKRVPMLCLCFINFC